MAKGSITISGIDELDKALEQFIGELDNVAEKSINESLAITESAMKTNAATMFNKGYSEGVMFNSISHTSYIGNNGQVFGDVGVYNMSNKTGSSDRRITAPLLAYFYEGGIQPHSLSPGARTERKVTPSNPRGRRAIGQEKGKLHPGSPAIPFLSNAFFTTSDNIVKIAIRNFNDASEKIQ